MLVGAVVAVVLVVVGSTFFMSRRRLVELELAAWPRVVVLVVMVAQVLRDPKVAVASDWSSAANGDGEGDGGGGGGGGKGDGTGDDGGGVGDSASTVNHHLYGRAQLCLYLF